jgi:hypothetical protein
MAIWRSLLLIYPRIDVHLAGNTGRHFTHILSEEEIRYALNSFEKFPGLVEELTSGVTGIISNVHRVERCLASVTPMGQEMHWPSPDDTREELDRFAAPGTFDSIFVLWPQQNRRAGSSVPCAGWGLGMRASTWSNDATYATVGNAERQVWEVPRPGEVWLHEWLHGVCAFFADQGYPIPDGDADGGGRHGYEQSLTTGWTDYYRDLMTAQVIEAGTRKGIPLHAWAHKPDHRSLV